jgi:hypothetical protein
MSAIDSAVTLTTVRASATAARHARRQRPAVADFLTGKRYPVHGRIGVHVDDRMAGVANHDSPDGIGGRRSNRWRYAGGTPRVSLGMTLRVVPQGLATVWNLSPAARCLSGTRQLRGRSSEIA